jgi:hypothetical protein
MGNNNEGQKEKPIVWILLVNRYRVWPCTIHDPIHRLSPVHSLRHDHHFPHRCKDCVIVVEVSIPFTTIVHAVLLGNDKLLSLKRGQFQLACVAFES